MNRRINELEKQLRKLKHIDELKGKKSSKAGTERELVLSEVI